MMRNLATHNTAPETDGVMAPSHSPRAVPVDAAVLDLEQRRLMAALGGDGQAFAALVRPHLPTMYRVAGRWARRHDLAEDAVQEAMQVAWQQLDRYTAGTSMRAWLLAIVSRRALTLGRSELRRRGREDASLAPQPPADPEQHAHAAHTAKVIDGVLQSMPEKRRQAVILRLDGGLAHAEIAAALGSTEGSVRVLVHMGLKQLKTALTAEAAEENGT